jgi:hypothetical protein
MIATACTSSSGEDADPHGDGVPSATSEPTAEPVDEAHEQPWLSPSEKVDSSSAVPFPQDSPETLESMSTKALITTVLQSRELILFLAYNTPRAAVAAVSQEYDALAELLQREDVDEQLQAVLERVERGEVAFKSFDASTFLKIIIHRESDMSMPLLDNMATS